MLDKISTLFKKEYQLGHMAALMNHVANMVGIFRSDFMKDGDAKNAAIDALCELLQQHKDKGPENEKTAT